GSAVNVALPAGTRDAGWLRAFHATVPHLLRVFRPQVLVSQHGCDTHWSDPLANLQLTIDAQRAAHAAIHRLAPETAGGRPRATAGWRREAAAIRWSRWCPGPGPTCSRRRPTARSTRRRKPRERGASTCSAAPGGPRQAR